MKRDFDPGPDHFFFVVLEVFGTGFSQVKIRLNANTEEGLGTFTPIAPGLADLSPFLRSFPALQEEETLYLPA